MFCPHCGRCLGECTSSDDTCVEKVLIEKPKQLKKKQMLHKMKCIKCKEHVYISLEFID